MALMFKKYGVRRCFYNTTGIPLSVNSGISSRKQIVESEDLAEMGVGW